MGRYNEVTLPIPPRSLVFVSWLEAVEYAGAKASPARGVQDPVARSRILLCALCVASSTLTLHCNGDGPPPEPLKTLPVTGSTLANTARRYATAPDPTRFAHGFVYARAFEFNRGAGTGEFCFSIVDRNGRLCPSAKRPGIGLSYKQADLALEAFAEPTMPEATGAWCFEPHHAVVFYNVKDQPIAAMSVCFECDRRNGWHPGQHVGEGPPMATEAVQMFRRLFCTELELEPCGPER